ncbi:thioredoxin-related protein [Lewinella aquimaris]|uniref:Thioredoxin-related protein n=1 Tax=Neolewinella aquimaris TaxID=1835722 RepID=A0A840DWM8_9BACT|nr:thioredoxin family protein [Neolewinella aquimaris]MBB4077604.1 thioredoxin-related protein [Neolewinella aquimaris]
MKLIIPLLLLCICSGAVDAQFWAADFATAQGAAGSDGKHIVLVFSGSDWCAPCIKLDREIWQDEGFRAAAGEEFVFYRADFPRKKENRLPEAIAATNGELANQYNRGGSFPLVVVITPEGETVGLTGYLKSNPAEYLALLRSFTAQ